jgi:hypothetical protein
LFFKTFQINFYFRITLFEDNLANIKNFYHNYSVVKSLDAEEFDHKKLADSIQNELDEFVNWREKKRLDEIEHKKMVELLINKKREEEEYARIAKKKAEEEAALVASQTVNFFFVANFSSHTFNCF